MSFVCKLVFVVLCTNMLTPLPKSPQNRHSGTLLIPFLCRTFNNCASFSNNAAISQLSVALQYPNILCPLLSWIVIFWCTQGVPQKMEKSNSSVSVTFSNNFFNFPSNLHLIFSVWIRLLTIRILCSIGNPLFIHFPFQPLGWYSSIAVRRFLAGIIQIFPSALLNR